MSWSEQALAEDLESFLRRYYHTDESGRRSRLGTFLEAYPSERRTFYVDFDDLERYDAEVADDVVADPEWGRGVFEQALRDYPLPTDQDLAGARVNFANLPARYERPIGDFRTSDEGHLRLVRGQVTHKTESLLRVTEAVFECQRCGTTTEMPVAAGDLQEPYECAGCERQGPYRLAHEQSEKLNYQRIRVQLPPERAVGQANETVDIDLYEDLVGAVEVGDRIRATAALKPDPRDDDSATYQWYAEAEHVETEETDFEDIDVGPHRERIEAIAASDDPYQQLVNSIKPSHRGHEEIKLALALQMFGGVAKRLPDGSRKRGDSHVLLVGDPATDKSGLLEYATQLAPRSIKTSGKSASGVGLTAAAVRDDFGGDQWTLQGGAMVKADKGLCAVDELDKMPEEERGSMLQALAEQQVSVSKAGINATLPARTKLLAAANPIYGRFDPYAPISDQIQLSPPLLSRFDLIFTLTDEVDADSDREMARHINNATRAATAPEERLNGEVDGVTPDIEPEVIRAYVAHARQTCDPYLTEAAAQVLEDEYVSIRTVNETDGGEDTAIPVTARKIEAAHRLAEASARVRLSDTVEVEDVERALTLIKRCLRDVGLDTESGEFDADMVEAGGSHSQQERRQLVLRLVDEHQDDYEEPGIPRRELVELADHEDLPEGQVDAAVDHWLEAGELYCPGAGQNYRRT